MNRQRTTVLTLICLSAGLVGIAGCQRSDDRSIIYLVEHFRKNKLPGRYRRLNGDPIKAIEAGRLVGENFDVEFAKFEDPKDAKHRAKRGYKGFKCYANGQFLMLVRSREPGTKVVKVFKDF